MGDFTDRENWGKLVLRVGVAGLLLFHGIGKVGSGGGGIESALDANGLPTFLAYGAYVGEVIAPLLVITGVYAVPAAAVMVFQMIMAIYLAHSGDVFALNSTGGWAIELQMLYLLGSLAIVLIGPGRIVVRFGHD